MSKLLLSALKAKYEAEKAEAMANIENLINNSHNSASIVRACDRYIDEFVNADKKLNTLSIIFTVKQTDTSE